ncbi:MAG: DUF2723 domain-containing protein [Anaerolineae bacterium]|nr:DUF2723 domain-containing protein [Anaerolineae bacterium]
MTAFFNRVADTARSESGQGQRLRLIGAVLILLIVPLLYLGSMATGLVVGDPTEYTFVANVLGIAHPPGYAFLTLLGHVYQKLIPFGGYPWRMHLVSVTAATVAVFCVFGIVRTIGELVRPNRYVLISALFGATTVGTAANFWQHAIHANPHIITALFLVVNLYALTKWFAAERSERRNNGWLYLFCLSVGFGVTHHPLTVFALVACVLFVLWIRPKIIFDWRTLLKGTAFVLLGLAVWLYFPLRAPALVGTQFPGDMNTLDGFLNLALARGLRVNLFHFGLADQLNRLTVFWTLLRLQYALPVIFLSVLGWFWLIFVNHRGHGEHREESNRISSVSSVLSVVSISLKPLAFLYGGAFLLNYVFVINTVQDVMAYLLGPFLIVGMLSGVGLFGLLYWMQTRLRVKRRAGLLFGLLIAALFLLGPMLQIARNGSLVSLRDYSEGDDYVAAVFDYFDGQGEGAVLLNDWERMTPLYYTQLVEGQWPDERDIRPIFVSSAKPWIDHVYENLPGGPVYLNGYRSEIPAAGFRLRPRGPFYQVVEPGDTAIPPELTLVSAAIDDFELVAFALPETTVQAGDYVPLTLALRTPTGTENYYVPVLHVGDIVMPFTTDSHLTTNLYEPGEVIVERFDFALPHNLAPGTYPVTVRVQQLIEDVDTGIDVFLGELTVTANPDAPRVDGLLANFRQRVGLAGATARDGFERRTAPWAEPIYAAPGDVIDLTLEWKSLAPTEESYTIFVHLIDLANRPILSLDYTPLGGATPTHLWFPKWLPGQQMLDPYRMELPPDLPPGQYLIEVGLYEMTGRRRLLMSDANGNHIGDRTILGSVIVE